MATATTQAQYNRNVDQAELIGFHNFLNIFIGIIEAVGWATFGVLLYQQIALAVWAFAMVYGRFHLIKVKIMALRKGQTKLANMALWMTRLSVIITFISIFTVWAELMDSYAKYEQAQSAPVRIAQMKMEGLKSKYQGILSAYSEEELSEARVLQSRLMAELNQFWGKTHAGTNLRYEQIISEDGNPKSSPWGGGLLKTAALVVNGEYQNLQNQFLKNKPLLAAVQKLEETEKQLREVQIELTQAQSITGIESVNNTDIYPAGFVRLSQLTKNSLSPSDWINILGVAGIILILVMSVVIGEGISIAPESDPKTKPKLQPSLWQILMGKIKAKLEK